MALQDLRFPSREPVRDPWIYRGSKWRPRVLAAVIGVLIWAITQLLHFLLYPELDKQVILRRMPADALAAVVVGLLFFQVMDQAYKRRAAVLARLAMIVQLNHHIRNALHVISLSAYSTQNKQAIETIGESVDRINRALREILPGDSKKAGD